MHDLFHRVNRTLSLLMVALFISGMVLAGVPPRQSLAAPVNCGVSGEAYVANVAALGLLQTKLGGVTLGGGSGAQVNLNLLNALTTLQATAVSATSTDTSTGATAEATSVATIAGLNLDSNVSLPVPPILVLSLGSLLNTDLLNITADAITVTAKSSSSVGNPTTYTGTTNVVNLTIGNQTIADGDVAPNTIIPVFLNVPLLNINLVQIAKVTVNEQKFVNGSLVVNGLHVEILPSNLPALANLQVGDIILGSATAKATCTGSVPAALSITNVSPAQGPITGGTTVTISGTGFTPTSTVNFDNSPASVVSIGAEGTTITATSPAHAAGTVGVTVTNTAGSPLTATLPNSFTYVNTPTLISVSASCVSGTITLTITGTDLLLGGLDLPLVSVNGNLLPAASLTAGNNQITATIASSLLNQGVGAVNTVGVGDPLGILSVPLTGLLDISGLTSCLTNTGPITVTGILPNTGPTTGGTPVLISGSGFQTGATVTFGGVAATNVTVVAGNGQITAVTPPHAAGAVDVVVTNPSGTPASATLTGGFTYLVAPTLGNVSACIANGVAIVTVSGTGFLPGTLLSINGTGLQNTDIVINNANQLTATVASNLLNLSGINVFVATNPGNILSTQLSLGTLNACPNPTVNSINPNQGPTTGGTIVTIGGTNFQVGTSVTFGGSPATNVTVNSSTSLTATTPIHAAGAVDVVITSPATGTQPYTVTNGFTFIASPSTSPSASPSTSPSPSASPSTSPSPNPSTPGGTENTPPTLTALFLVGTGQVPPMTNGRVTFLATIQDNAALGGVEASMNANGPWQRVVDISGNGAGPFRIAGGFDTTNAAFGGSATPGNKTVYLRAFDAQNNVSANQTLLVNYPSEISTFSDVNGDPATVEAIYQLNARGIIRGYGDGTFGPNDPTVRAQMAALIARSMGWGNEEHGNSFPDRGPVDDELWRQVGTLDFYGVARGYSDAATCASAGTSAPCYIPLDSVSNVQTISFITRAMVRLGYWTQQQDNPNLYPNIPADSGHRSDLATYFHYVGAVPGTSPSLDWASYNQPASRAFFALAEWQVVQWRENSANWGIIPRP